MGYLITYITQLLCFRILWFWIPNDKDELWTVDNWRCNNLFFKDKKAMLSFTTGAIESMFSSEGISGDINVALWPLQVSISSKCIVEIFCLLKCWSSVLIVRISPYTVYLSPCHGHHGLRILLGRYKKVMSHFVIKKKETEALTISRLLLSWVGQCVDCRNVTKDKTKQKCYKFCISVPDQTIWPTIRSCLNVGRIGLCNLHTF